MAKFRILRNEQINQYLPIPAGTSGRMVERKQTNKQLNDIIFFRDSSPRHS